LRVRLSDLLEGAPENVLESIAHILLAKIYRKRVEAAHMARYRKYVAGHDISAKARLVRQIRGRKRIDTPQGDIFHLEEIFEDLNSRFFHGLLARPQMTWSKIRSRRSLGHYDPAHNAIVVSRIFDHPAVPRYAVEYIVYHEMLHLKHPVKLRGSRRCVHGKEFQAEEKLFPQVTQAKAFLKTL
jgi:predicted metal-dependent hydrolase